MNKDDLWRVPKHLILISSEKGKLIETSVVDYKHKTSIEKARQYHRAYDGDTFTNWVEMVEPKECILENCGLSIWLSDEILNSYLTGSTFAIKCLVAKDNAEYKITLNAKIILRAILDLGITDGKINGTFSITMNDGVLGIIEDVKSEKLNEIYKNTLNNRDKTTSKYIIGKNYLTEAGNIDTIYLGKLYKWIELVFEQDGTNYYNQTIGVKLLDEPKEFHFVISRYSTDGCKTVSDVFRQIDCKVMHSNIPEIVNMAFYSGYLYEKLPKRYEGDISLNIEGNEVEELQNCINNGINWLSNKANEFVFESFISHASIIGITATKDNKPTYTKEQRKVFADRLNSGQFIDYGDEKVYGTLVKKQMII